MDTKKKIEQEPDFIDSPRYDNSLSKFVLAKIEGVDDKTVAKLLHMTEEEVRDSMVRVIDKIRKAMKIE
jgi:hypothetical protein